MLRKVLTGIVVLALFILTTVGIGLHTLHKSALNPAFYSEHFAAVDTYRTLGHTVAPKLVRKTAQQQLGSIPSSVNEEINAVVSGTLNETLLEGLTVNAIEEVLTGLRQTDGPIQLTVPTEALIRSLGTTLENQLNKSATLDIIYEQVTKRVSTNLATYSGLLPFSLKTNASELNKVINDIAPLNWIKDQASAQLPGVIEFLVKKGQPLHLKIGLQSRHQIIASALEKMVEKSDLTPFLLQRVVKPALSERLGGKVLVVTGSIRLSQTAILAALKDVLATDWGKAQRRAVTQVLAQWITGKRDDLALEIPLKPLKVWAVDRLTGMVTKKVARHLKKQPECTALDIKSVVDGSKDPLTCRPTELYASAHGPVVALLIKKAVHTAIDTEVPDYWPFDELGWMETRSHRNVWVGVQKMRNSMVSGVIIDELELRRFLASALPTKPQSRTATNLLDTVLPVTRGQKFGSVDLVKEAPKNTTKQLRTALQLIDGAWIPTLIGISLAILLLFTLGPETWSGRLNALGAPLLASGLLLFIAAIVAPGQLPELPQVIHDVPIALNALVERILHRIQVTASVVGALGVVCFLAKRWTPKS